MHVGGNGGMDTQSSFAEVMHFDRNGDASVVGNLSAITERISGSIALMSVMYSIGLERKKIYEYNCTAQKHSCFGA